MIEQLINEVANQYQLEERDMGELSEIKKGLYRFSNRAYEIKNIGNLFTMKMSAMFGLMKMETIVITPKVKDLSFCNLDIVHALGNDTYMFEMYKTCIKEIDLSRFELIKKSYSHLPDYKSESRWYDDYRLNSCIAKRGKKMSQQGDALLMECLKCYLDVLKDAPVCDCKEKIEANSQYVNRLIAEGGTAVDSMNKMLGTEKTSKLIKEYMYDI